MVTRVFTADEETRAALGRLATVELEAEPAIVFAYLYGSAANADRFRDVDVGVFVRGDQGEAIADRLAARLAARLGMPVDVRVLNQAPVTFLFHILQGRLLLNRDTDLLTDLIERTVRTYLDVAPVLRRATREAFAE